jgi:hypothetical protein
MSARELGWRWLAGAVAVFLSVLGVAVAGIAVLAPGHARADPVSTTIVPASASSTVSPDADAPAPQPVSVEVSPTETSLEPLPAGFLGLSVEFSALHAYLGRNPKALNPVFLALLTGIDQGHQPVLRVGGDSTDDTWLPLPGVLPPLGVSYTITPDWLATVRALTRQTDARLILGVNLAADDPQIATVEARALVDGIGRHYVQDLEVGNEPDLYLHNGWYDLPDGTVVTRRAVGYSFGSYIRDLNHWRAILPNGSIAAGAVATLSWLPSLVPIAPQFPDVTTVTVHRYALTNCGVPSNSPLYPTVANLLSDASTSGLAAPLAPYAIALHAADINLRVDELNSASCEGTAGVSDSFASALWIVDTLFNMAGADVDGVNIHTLPGSEYAPFSFTQSGSTWVADVHPLYYGLLFFAAAFPPGAELLASTNSSADSGGDVKSYTTIAPDGTLRTTLINEDATRAADVELALPSSDPLTAETLTAPALTSTDGVALGGQSFPDATTLGKLNAPQTTQVEPTGDDYSIVVPAASAVLLTSTG